MTNKPINLLEEAIQYEDCPPMVMNILANLHRKLGNNQRAAQIYTMIYERSRDPSYQDLARRKLEEMAAALGVSGL